MYRYLIFNDMNVLTNVLNQKILRTLVCIIIYYLKIVSGAAAAGVTKSED